MRVAARRLVSVPALVLVAAGFVVLAPVWVPVALVWDLVSAPRRRPRTRLMSFGLWWSWLEVAGLVASGWLFVTRRARDLDAHYALMRWWANGLVVGLRRTCRVVIEARHPEHLVPGPVIVLPRHASLADALLSAWLVTHSGLEPRYVLKRELLVDPCLDIVGNRIPSHFLDRDARDRAPELDAIRMLAAGASGPRDCVVIFPEGTRFNPDKRARSLDRIAARDPDRAARLGALHHLNPPRPAGTLAALEGAPDADVVIVAHAGFEGLDTFGGILRAIPGRAPVVLDCLRVDRRDVPSDADARARWLDDQWLALDQRVGALLAERAATGPGGPVVRSGEQPASR